MAKNLKPKYELIVVGDGGVGKSCLTLHAGTESVC